MESNETRYRCLSVEWNMSFINSALQMKVVNAIGQISIYRNEGRHVIFRFASRELFQIII